MKVYELIEKLRDLKDLQAKLEVRQNDDDVTGNDSELMYRAADAIYEYIAELERKEVRMQ